MVDNNNISRCNPKMLACLRFLRKMKTFAVSWGDIENGCYSSVVSSVCSWRLPGRSSRSESEEVGDVMIYVGLLLGESDLKRTVGGGKVGRYSPFEKTWMM